MCFAATSTTLVPSCAPTRVCIHTAESAVLLQSARCERYVNRFTGNSVAFISNTPQPCLLAVCDHASGRSD